MKAYRTDHMVHHLTNLAESFSRPAYDLSDLLPRSTYLAQVYACTNNIVSGGGCEYLAFIARTDVSLGLDVEVGLGIDRYKVCK